MRCSSPNHRQQNSSPLPRRPRESAATTVSAVLAGMLQQVALIEQAGTSAEREAQYDALAKMLAAAVPPAQHNLEQVSIPSDEYVHATEVDTPTQSDCQFTVARRRRDGRRVLPCR